MVSTALTFMEGDVAGLYLIGTDEACRRRGFGTAVTLFAIRDCFNEGAENIILHATRMGESVYRNIGFKKYCYFDIMWYTGKMP